jgi:hypothetical protein
VAGSRWRAGVRGRATGRAPLEAAPPGAASQPGPSRPGRSPSPRSSTGSTLCSLAHCAASTSSEQQGLCPATSSRARRSACTRARPCSDQKAASDPGVLQARCRSPGAGAVSLAHRSRSSCCTWRWAIHSALA